MGVLVIKKVDFVLEKEKIWVDEKEEAEKLLMEKVVEVELNGEEEMEVLDLEKMVGSEDMKGWKK